MYFAKELGRKSDFMNKLRVGIIRIRNTSRYPIQSIYCIESILRYILGIETKILGIESNQQNNRNKTIKKKRTHHAALREQKLIALGYRVTGIRRVVA